MAIAANFTAKTASARARANCVEAEAGDTLVASAVRPSNVTSVDFVAQAATKRYGGYQSAGTLLPYGSPAKTKKSGSQKERGRPRHLQGAALCICVKEKLGQQPR